MRKRPKPHEQPTFEDIIEATETVRELVKVLAGRGHICDQDFLKRMARVDELVAEEDKTSCGCYYTIIGAQVAREMIEEGEYEDVAVKLAEETERRWRKSKFVRLWNKEKK